ncbi:hypothetical protein BBP07_08725 [Citrobacter koseri]|nr:hypothetical protein BBP07_08725 [Citrobacter koseri]STB29952.1 Uncharacterised protein [Citrobacter koseri]
MKFNRAAQNSYFFCFIYLLWVFFIHICGSQYFTLFDVDTLIKYFNGAIILSLFTYFLFSYRVNKSALIDIALVIVFFVGYIYFRKGVLILFFILLCRHIPFSMIIKTFMFATLLGMLFVLFTYALNLYPETHLDLFREDGNYRYSLGYRFPTFLPNFYFHLVLCWFFLRKGKVLLGEIIIILIINYFLYELTDTRAVFALVTLFCIVIIFLKYLSVSYNTFILGRIFGFFTKYSFIVFGFIAIYFQYTYDPSISWLAKLNDIFSGRLALGHWGFELYDVSLFGNLVEFVSILDASKTNKFFYIDSAYVQLLLVYGLIIYFLVMIAYTKIGKDIVSRGEKYFGIVLIFLFAHSITDPQLMSPEFNPFLLCLGYYGLAKYKENVFK